MLPRGLLKEPVFAAWHSLNGCGEIIDVTWIEESRRGFELPDAAGSVAMVECHHRFVWRIVRPGKPSVSSSDHSVLLEITRMDHYH